jgi:hypothetical protein
MKHKKYRFSFTAASLQVPTMIALARKMIREGCTTEQLLPDDMRKERYKTSQREFREIKDRLECLSPDEIRILSDGSHEEQKLISLVSFARLYHFFYEFMTEVVAEKILVFDYALTEMDYNVFFNRKAVDHPEVDQLTTATQNKVKQIVFKVLEQAGIINNIQERLIQIPQLSPSFIALLSSTNPQDIKILLN